MINRILLLLTGASLVCLPVVIAQTNIYLTNPDADAVLKGNYNAADYASSDPINVSSEIVQGILDNVSADTLEALLEQLVFYHNRNSGSDTTSDDRGIGAARRWIHWQFQQYSARNENRLLVSYLNFNDNICNVNRHANVMGILPGADPDNHSIMIIEGHMDSRCEVRCDIDCKAHGADDNGSGTVLVMEAARVMSRYTFNETIIFTTVTGEEQGLHGSTALAEWVQDNNLPVKGVQNNDVIGGIECGPTASPPGCSGEGDLDSVTVRIYSADVNFSRNKAFARYVKEQYDKFARPHAEVPMTIDIMDQEDRGGRGGDHAPFAERGYRAIRFTEANEHGNASGVTAGRQHTPLDVIGLDENNDGEYEEYYVNFDYLARNVVVNAMGLAMAASAPDIPSFSLEENGQGQTRVEVTDPDPSHSYLVGIRTNDNTFDYTFVSTSSTIPIQGVEEGKEYFVAIAALDSNGVQSLFTQEQRFTAGADGPATVSDRLISGPDLSLKYIRDDQMIRGVIQSPLHMTTGQGTFLLKNTKGQILARKKLSLKPGEISFTVPDLNLQAGVYYGTLVVGEYSLAVKKVSVKR